MGFDGIGNGEGKRQSHIFILVLRFNPLVSTKKILMGLLEALNSLLYVQARIVYGYNRNVEQVCFHDIAHLSITVLPI